MKLLVICVYGRSAGIHTVSGKESDGGTLGTGTTSSTNTMDIILRVIWVVIVKHMSNVADILKSKG